MLRACDFYFPPQLSFGVVLLEAHGTPLTTTIPTRKQMLSPKQIAKTRATYISTDSTTDIGPARCIEKYLRKEPAFCWRWLLVHPPQRP